MNTSKVTIGIPVYNDAKYLGRAIESVLQQTYKDFKLIIADNCSSDESHELAQSYENRDERITVFRHDENMGPVSNFNFLLEKADTEFFGWLGAHDYQEPTFLEELISQHEKHPDTTLVYGKVAGIDFDGNFLFYAHNEMDNSGLSKVDGGIKAVTSKTYNLNCYGIYRTSFLKGVPMEQILCPEDLQLFLAGCLGTVIQVDSVLYKGLYREEGSDRNRFDRYIKNGIITGEYLQRNYLKSQTELRFIKYILKFDWSLSDKVKLILGIHPTFKKRHNVTFITLLIVFVRNGFKL